MKKKSKIKPEHLGIDHKYQKTKKQIEKEIIESQKKRKEKMKPKAKSAILTRIVLGVMYGLIGYALCLVLFW